MPTLVKSYIANDGVNPGGYDYVFTSLQAWWDDPAIQGNITAILGRDEIHEAHLKGEEHVVSDIALITSIGDSLTDDTHYHTIKAAPGAEFRGILGVSGVARISSEFGSTVILEIGTPYMRLEHFLVHNCPNTTFGVRLSADSCRINGCGIDTISNIDDQGLVIGIAAFSVNDCVITNNLVSRIFTSMDLEDSFEKQVVAIGVLIGPFNNAGLERVICLNNVVAYIEAEGSSPGIMGPYAYGYFLAEEDASNKFYNNAAFFCLTSAGGPANGLGFFVGTTVGDADYNASDDGTYADVGAHSIQIVPADNFIDLIDSLLNCHLKATAPMAAAGFDTGGFVYNQPTDIDGQVYDGRWPIGYDRLVIINNLSLGNTLDFTQQGSMITVRNPTVGDSLSFTDGASIEDANIPLGPSFMLISKRKLPWQGPFRVRYY